jgi:hypothetical protein
MKTTITTVFVSIVLSGLVSLISIEFKQTNERGSFIEWQKNIDRIVMNLETTNKQHNENAGVSIAELKMAAIDNNRIHKEFNDNIQLTHENVHKLELRIRELEVKISQHYNTHGHEDIKQ